MPILSEKMKLREYLKNKYRNANNSEFSASFVTGDPEEAFLQNFQKSGSEKLNESTVPANIRSRFIGFRANSVETLRENLVKEYLFKIFVEAYPMDKGFKVEKRNALLKAFNKVYGDSKAELLKEYESIDVYAKENPHCFYSKLITGCTAAAQDQFDIDIYNKTGCTPGEINADIKSMNYVLNEKPFVTESKKELDKSLDNEMDLLNKSDCEEITDVINQKVVNSVVAEKKKAQEIVDQEKEDEQKIDDSVAPEDDNLADTEDEDYKAGAGNIGDGEAEIDKETKKDEDEEEVKQESYQGFKKLGLKSIKRNKFNTPSLFKSIHMNVMRSYILENQSVSESTDPVTINADSVFAEALCYYTLLETFNTVGMIPSNVDDDIKRRYIKQLVASI